MIQISPSSNQFTPTEQTSSIRKTQNDGGNFQRRFSNKFKMTLEISNVFS